MRAAVKSLNKKPDDRTKYDHKTLTAFFLTVKCFKDLNISMKDLKKVIDVTNNVYIPKHEVLFRHGDHGTAFFICLSGKSQLFILNP